MRVRVRVSVRARVERMIGGSGGLAHKELMRVRVGVRVRV